MVEQIFARAISGCCAELCGKMHPGQAGNAGELGQSDISPEMGRDILFDAAKAPLRQGINPGARHFGTG